MYPESNIKNMIEGLKTAKKDDRRATEIKRFLLQRRVIVTDNFTYERI